MTSRLPDSETASLEAERLVRQAELDAARSAKERNSWGQFATPPNLARDIACYTLSVHPQGDVNFFEPSCGSGAFFSALLDCLGPSHRLAAAEAAELDGRFADLATELWGGRGLRVTQGDFLDPRNTPDGTVTLLIANPPYVRHHHLNGVQKRIIAARCLAEIGIRPSGLSGLYLYFVLLSHKTLAPGAISSWLIPAEFMDVNYGRGLKEYLAKRVTLKRIHRFDPEDTQFDDALVTSAVVVFENTPPDANSLAEFTFGGSMQSPRDVHEIRQGNLVPDKKWGAMFRPGSEEHSDPTLKDYFRIRRGIATGSNKFFVMTVREAEERGFKAGNVRPMMPSPRYVKGDVVGVAANGYPDTEPQLVVIDTDESLDDLEVSDPKLAEYLRSADESILGGYLVRGRKPWYRQEQRTPAPFLLTYMGRGVELERPFKFILNKSNAIASNMYLMLYPTPLLQRYIDSDEDALNKVHAALLSLTGDDLRNGGRVYGGGLHKMEPKELAVLRAKVIKDLDPALLDVAHEPALF